MKTQINKMPNSDSSFASCLRPTTADDNRHSPEISGKANLATCIYHTDLGLFSLTWSQSLLGRSLDLHLHSAVDFPTSPLSSSLSFHLNISPFCFWRKNGSKTTAPAVQIFWDLSRAKFGSGPEPLSGFYVAVVVDGEMTLLIGDSAKRAYAKTKAQKPSKSQSQSQFLLLRREHAIGHRVYTTRARFGGKCREISVSCDDARLIFSVEKKKVLEVKHLKWKFRGNERIEVDGVAVQVSWDVYNWLFDDAIDAHAVFIFRFENELGAPAQALSSPCSLGMNGAELRKMRKSFLKSSGRSSSSVSSACSSSVMEWASTEESDRLSSPTGFSLVVYAWKK